MDDDSGASTDVADVVGAGKGEPEIETGMRLTDRDS